MWVRIQQALPVPLRCETPATLSDHLPLGKSTVLPDMKVSGLVAFASRDFQDLPDTLALQYLVPDHPPVELGRFTLGVDSIPRL